MNQNIRSIDEIEIDELDRIGTDDLMQPLGLASRASVFRFIKNSPTFPKAKKIGFRNSWARGAVVRWLLSLPDRDGGDPAIAERLMKARKVPHRFHPRKAAKPKQPDTTA